ncbi:unnamed protein product, partial [Porites evermanni]
PCYSCWSRRRCSRRPTGSSSSSSTSCNTSSSSPVVAPLAAPAPAQDPGPAPIQAVPEVADAQPVSVLSRCVCIFSLAFCFAFCR